MSLSKRLCMLTFGNYSVIFTLEKAAESIKFYKHHQLIFRRHMMSTYFFSLSQHLSCHRNDRNAFVNFLFPQIRMYEWFEGYRNPRASKNKKTCSFCCLLKLQMDPIRVRKWMANSKRKDITVCLAFIWTLVLGSRDPLSLSCIFLRCFHRETINSRKHVRDIVKDMRFPSIRREKAMAPTPVLLPGKSHGRRSLVACSPWRR